MIPITAPLMGGEKQYRGENRHERHQRKVRGGNWEESSEWEEKNEGERSYVPSIERRKLFYLFDQGDRVVTGEYQSEEVDSMKDDLKVAYLKTISEIHRNRVVTPKAASSDVHFSIQKL